MAVCVSTSVMTNIALHDHIATKIGDNANQKMFHSGRHRPTVGHYVSAGQAMTFGELFKQLQIATETVTHMQK